LISKLILPLGCSTLKNIYLHLLLRQLDYLESFDSLRCLEVASKAFEATTKAFESASKFEATFKAFEAASKEIEAASNVFEAASNVYDAGTCEATFEAHSESF
jgi:hypothetical protein